MLTELRASGGLPQTHIATALGTPQSYVSKYETGERRLDFAELMDVLDVLGADPHVFVDRYLAAVRNRSARSNAKAAVQPTRSRRKTE